MFLHFICRIRDCLRRPRQCSVSVCDAQRANNAFCERPRDLRAIGTTTPQLARKGLDRESVIRHSPVEMRTRILSFVLIDHLNLSRSSVEGRRALWNTACTNAEVRLRTILGSRIAQRLVNDGCDRVIAESYSRSAWLDESAPQSQLDGNPLS